MTEDANARAEALIAEVDKHMAENDPLAKLQGNLLRLEMVRLFAGEDDIDAVLYNAKRAVAFVLEGEA